MRALKTKSSVEEITSVEELEALRPEWSELWARCASATPFQSPEWLIPWWKHIGEGDLWTLALRDQGRLVGLAPFYVYTQADSGEREVFPIGIATTDYLDALLAPGYERRGMREIFAHLDAARDQWDACYLPELRPGSPLL